MIWRDDDILQDAHGLDELLRVDDLFQASGRKHTIAVIASRMTPELAAAIRDRGMRAQLHCWNHDDLSVNAEAVDQLPMALEAIEDAVGVRPTVLYPPWNRTSPMLEAAAAALGLVVSAVKISLEQFIRVQGRVSESTINFHYWHQPDVDLLEEAFHWDRDARLAGFR